MTMPARIIGLVVAGFVFLAAWLGLTMTDVSGEKAQPKTPVPVGVLGDSDSHAYQDKIMMPPASGKRGGAFRDRTFQWTEILARMRPTELDFGPWGTWGTPIKIAETLDWLGLGGRAPRKMDYRYNFAVNGAECEDLVSGYYRQAPRLRDQILRERDRWRDGVVVIQIGINSLGQNDALEGHARDGLSATTRRKVNACVEAHRAAMEMLAAVQPKLKFVVVGISDNSIMPANHAKWATVEEQRRIREVLDAFDDGLREIVARRKGAAAFFDLRSWIANLWGTRDARGMPAYREVSLGGPRPIGVTQGDEPHHLALKDNHGGNVYNAMWAQQLVQLLRDDLKFAVSPPTMREIATFVDPDGRLGLRAP
jgi:lysophospholipase L1-like esterase